MWFVSANLTMSPRRAAPALRILYVMKYTVITSTARPRPRTSRPPRQRALAGPDAGPPLLAVGAPPTPTRRCMSVWNRSG